MPLRIKYQTEWGGDEGNGAAGGLAGLALLMKEPQSVTRLYFSCLRVFHGRRQEGGGEDSTGTSLIRRSYWGKGREGWCSLKAMTVERLTYTLYSEDQNLHPG